MKLYLSLVFVLLSVIAKAQLLNTTTSVTPVDITVCGVTKTFSVTINNPSPFTLSNVKVAVMMPIGVMYVPTSVVNASDTITIATSNPNFTVANLPTLTAVTVTFTAKVTCGVLPFLASGTTIENKYKITYTGNGTNYVDNHTTVNYSIKQPNLSITTFTNQSYAGNIGDTYTRCITVTNGGVGELSEFTLTDAHGNGVIINSVSNGVWTATAGLETVVLNATHFTAIGNGNTLFESGESITICENVTVNNCTPIGVLSSIEAGWGCNGSVCQSSISSANVVFPNLAPNLVVTPTGGLNACLGNGFISTQQLKFKNTGVGQAINIVYDIFNSTGAGYWNGMKTKFDLSAITYTLNGGAPIAIAVTSSSPLDASAACSGGVSSSGAFKITLPDMNPNDEIILFFNSESCCESYVNNGWRFKGTYESICTNTYTTVEDWGKVYNWYNSTLTTNNSPAAVVSGQSGTFNALFQSAYLTDLSGTGNNKITIDYIVPPCLTYVAGSAKIKDPNNAINHLATSVTIIGDTVRIEYSNNIQFYYDQFQALIDLQANCVMCAGGGNYNIQSILYYTPNNSCGCKVYLNTLNTPIEVVCPIVCEGLNLKAFKIERTSFGKADVNNDGVPEATAVVPTDVRVDRAMYGDTVTSTYNAVIKTSGTHPVWSNGYLKATITNGNNLTALGGVLQRYRAGLLITTTTVAPVSATSAAGVFDYNISTLIATSINNDSLVFTPQYKITTNIGGGTMQSATVTNDFYVSVIANPTLASDKFTCNNFKGQFSIIGYYYDNYGPDGYTTKSCDNVTFYQNYYLSIGQCCNNYAGGNLFPNEYRNWATIDTLKVTMPVGYTFISAYFNHVRTSGTLAAIGSTNYTITPLSTTTNVWSFYVGNYFSGASPTILPSDDGFYGTFAVTATPSCEAVGNVSVPIQYDWVYKPSVFLKQPYADNIITRNGQDNVNYAKPNVTIQSILPNVLAYSTTVNWDVVLTNTTATDANNVWFTVPNTGTVNVVKVEDITSGTTLLVPVGSIYQLGTLAGGAVKTYHITATYTSCTLDSIRASVGWNCGSYPTTLATAKCVNSSIKLQLSPQKPLLITSVINPPPLTNLCDTSEYVAEGNNIQLGSAYQLKLTAVLPAGVSIVPGTSYLAYPMSASYVLVGEPTFIGGTSYQYNISALNATIGTNGMPGILKTDSNNVKIKFKVVTGCGYTSGSVVSFGYDAKSACGQPTGQIVSLSSQLGINGATPPYLTTIKLVTTYISPCNGNNNFMLKVTNQGPLSFGAPDSVRLVLPLGISYIAGSSIFASNAPSVTEPRIVVSGGQQVLLWKLKNGVAVGDSVTINLQYTAQANALTCSIYTFSASSTSSSDLLCTSSGLTCGVIVNTGSTALPVFTFKGYLALNGGTGYTTPLGPNYEKAHVSFTINNTGEQINASNNTIISFYNDANGNGIYDPADVLLTKDTINATIPNSGSYMYNDSVQIPAGNCNIIARLDSSNNACSCNSDELLISLPLRELAVDGTICSGNSINIGKTAITGYTYAWTPTTNLTGASISNPFVTGTNTTGVAETTTYYVQVNRGGCIGYDTCNVVVNWTPTATAGGDQNLCNVFNTTFAATAPMGGVATGAWSQLSGPNTATITTPSAYNSGVTGLIEGSYDFIWTVSNGTCTPALDGITINVYNSPVAIAGANQDLCNIFNTTLAGNIPAGTSTGAWSQLSGPNTATITTPSAYNTTLTGLVEGTYNFTWTVSNGTCTPATSALIVKVYNSPIANAGVDQNLCSVFTTTLAGNNPIGTSTGMWTQLSGATATITTPTAYNSTLTGLAEGIYSFVWTVSNGTCTPVSDTLTINVYNKPIALAGVDKDLCSGFLFFTNFAANAPTGTATAVWSQLSGGPNTALIAAPASPTSMLSSLVEGVYNFVWTISNGTCPASKDTIVVKVSKKPIANAGVDQDICNTAITTFAGNAPVGTATGAWSQILGPNTATITIPTNYNSTATGLIEGSYTFIWTLSNGTCSPNSDAMIVRVNNTPIANAGSNQNLCNAFNTLLAGNINVGTAIGSWKQINGPSTATIVDTTLANSGISGLIEGTYNFVWTVKNGACTPAKDTVTINVYNTPVANAGVDQQLCNTFTTIFAATIPTGTSTGVWSQLSGVAATITTPTSYNSTLTGLIEGTYKFIWKVSNGNCTPVTDTVTIKVYNTPLAFAGTEQQLCNTFNTTLGGNVPVGTSTGSWKQLSGPNNSVITDTTLAASTLTGLAEGIYNFVWTVSNGTCTPVSDTVAIKVYNTPTATAGTDQQLCNTYVTAFAATIPVGTAKGVWSQLNGPTSSVIVTPSAYNSSVTALGEGVYNFVWTVSNGNCTPVTDTVTIKIYDTPVAKAGVNQNLCNSSSTSFTALAPAGTATGIWSQLIGGPNTATILLPTSKNASITGLVEGSYNFIWTVSNGNCTPATDTVTINVYNIPTANAGVDVNVCNNSIATLGAVLPAGTAHGKWSKQSGPSAVVFADTLLRTTNVSNLQEGIYKLVWTVSNGNCPNATDIVNVNVYNMPIANAGADIKACYVPLLPLNAQLPFGTSVGHWHDATTGGGSVTFVDSMQFNTSIKNLTPGFFDIVWVVENGSCPTTTDTLHITNYKIPIVDFSFDEDLICQGDCINFTDLTQTFMNDPIIIWKWDDGLFGSANLPNPMFCYGDSGVFYPRLTVTTAHGCLVSKTSNDSIRVKGKPVAEFKVDNLSETDDLITINTTSSNFNVLKWEMGDGTYFEHIKNTNYDYTYADTGWYKITLIASNKNNCTDTAIKKLYIKKRFTFYIPNSFSPNADFLNDIFTPKGTYFKNYHMTIYDRWGETIFVSDDVNRGWNGLLLDDSFATVGTYVYKISVDKLTGKTMNYKGTVTLMK